MDFLSQILFFFGALGAFNSLIVALYFLLSKSYASQSNKLFGFFLLVLSARVIKSLFYSFSSEEPIWFLQSGPSFFLLIGPLLLSYCACILDANSFWAKRSSYHISLWLVAAILVAVYIPFPAYVELNKRILLPAFNLQWLLYILGSFLLLKSSSPTAKAQEIDRKWLLLFLLANLLLWVAFFFIRFDYFVSGSIIFSFLFYSFLLFFLFNRKVSAILFKKVKTKSSTTISPTQLGLINQLEALMVSEEIFVDPHLKMGSVADKLQIPSHELSRLINQHLGKSFSEFINGYRVEKAKELLHKNDLYTIEAIGNQCGFHSKSAFYKAFKLHVGTTPAKYQQQT